MEKLLIIDDFEPVRKSIRRIADRENYQTLQAADGREGLAVFEREKPQIVITDLKMPYIDGRGVLCAIKEHSPETEVIVLTGYGDAETASFLMKNGAFSYLQKPLDLEQLLAVLAKARAKIRKEQGGSSEPKPTAAKPFHFEISSRREIVLGWSAAERERSLQSLRDLGEEFPCPMFVIGEGRRILFANRHAAIFQKTQAGEFGVEVISALRSGGLTVPSNQEFINLIDALLKSAAPEIQTESADLYALTGIMKAKVLDGDLAPMEAIILMLAPPSKAH